MNESEMARRREVTDTSGFWWLMLAALSIVTVVAYFREPGVAVVSLPCAAWAAAEVRRHAR